MSRYLVSPYGLTRPLAIKCVKFYLHYKRPFTAADLKTKGQTLKMLSDKGIIVMATGGRTKYSNMYTVPQSTIDYLMKTCPDEF